MVAQDGKIKLDNTLDSRLALISQQVTKHHSMLFCFAVSDRDGGTKSSEN